VPLQISCSVRHVYDTPFGGAKGQNHTAATSEEVTGVLVNPLNPTFGALLQGPLDNRVS
jgi:hypothetical protein